MLRRVASVLSYSHEFWNFCFARSRIILQRDGLQGRALSQLTSSMFAKTLLSVNGVNVPQESQEIELPNLLVHKYAKKRLPSGKAILYAQGGGFHLSFPELYKYQLDYFHVMTGYAVYSPETRLAPEAPFPRPLQDILNTYELIQKDGYKPENIIFMGDFSGGNLVLSAMLKLLDEKKPLPGGAVCFSPWVELKPSKPEHTTYTFNGETDMITEKFLSISRDHYVGKHPPADAPEYLFSPLRSKRLGELPPLFLTVGSNEILLDQVVDFAAAAGRQNHKDVMVSVVPDARHGIQLLAPFAYKESRDMMLNLMSWFCSIHPSDYHASSTDQVMHKMLHTAFNPDVPFRDVVDIEKESDESPVIEEYLRLHRSPRFVIEE